VLTIQPITQQARSRLQCCYNGSPAVPVTPELPPELLTIAPDTVQTTDPPGFAIVSGVNFQPGDEVVLQFGLFVVPLVTTYVDASHVNVDYDPATITPNLYTLTLRRAGVNYPSTVTFAVQAV